MKLPACLAAAASFATAMQGRVLNKRFEFPTMRERAVVLAKPERQRT
jgi:hypothetical protein